MKKLILVLLFGLGSPGCVIHDPGHPHGHAHFGIGVVIEPGHVHTDG